MDKIKSGFSYFWHNAGFIIYDHDSLDKQHSLAVARIHKVQLFLVCPLPCLQDCLDQSKNSLMGNGLEKAFPLKIALDQVIEVSRVPSAVTPVFWNRNVPKVYMLFLPYVHYVAVRTAVKSASSMDPGAGWFMTPVVYCLDCCLPRKMIPICSLLASQL